MRSNKPRKPSDFNQFRVNVYSASATMMDFDQYIEVYDELLHLLFWNYDIDTPLLLDHSEAKPYWGVNDDE